MAKKKAQQEVTVNMRLDNIELLGLSLSASNRPTEEVQVNFQIAVEHKFNLEHNTVFVWTQITVVSQNDPETVYGSLATSCVFSLQELDQFHDKESKAIILPETVSLTLNSIAISTTRGIMFSEFKGTQLHGAVLPILDPRQFAKAERNL